MFCPSGRGVHISYVCGFFPGIWSFLRLQEKPPSSSKPPITSEGQTVDTLVVENDDCRGQKTSELRAPDQSTQANQLGVRL